MKRHSIDQTQIQNTSSSDLHSSSISVCPQLNFQQNMLKICELKTLYSQILQEERFLIEQKHSLEGQLQKLKLNLQGLISNGFGVKQIKNQVDNKDLCKASKVGSIAKINRNKTIKKEVESYDAKQSKNKVNTLEQNFQQFIIEIDQNSKQIKNNNTKKSIKVVQQKRCMNKVPYLSQNQTACVQNTKINKLSCMPPKPVYKTQVKCSNGRETTILQKQKQPILNRYQSEIFRFSASEKQQVPVRWVRDKFSPRNSFKHIISDIGAQ